MLRCLGEVLGSNVSSVPDLGPVIYHADRPYRGRGAILLAAGKDWWHVSEGLGYLRMTVAQTWKFGISGRTPLLCALMGHAASLLPEGGGDLRLSTVPTSTPPDLDGKNCLACAGGDVADGYVFDRARCSGNSARTFRGLSAAATQKVLREVLRR